MSRNLRFAVAMPALAVVVAVLLWGYTGLPDFGATIASYGAYIDHVASQGRHVTNLVTAVMFDYRGLDTLVEELILIGSVLGVALLLRSTREAPEQHRRDVLSSDTIRVAGLALLPVTALLGLWLVTFGYVTPGGGFQGGVLASGGALLLWLAVDYRLLRGLAPATFVEAVEGLGAGGYVGIGFLGVAGGGAFLANVLPLGSAGTLLSGGTIAVLNWVAAAEVAAAFVLLYEEFLEEYTAAFAGGGHP